MSYNTSTNGKGENEVKVVTMLCNDESGCKARISTEKGENKGTLNARARQLGWRGFSATEHYCPLHSNFRTGKPKADKVTKSKVAQTKAEKAPAVAKKANKVTTKPVVTKATAIGQSTGKLARSAKKSAVK